MTRKILPSLMFVAALTATCPAGARERMRINFDWRFAHNEQSGGEQVGYDDSAWQTVHLPHDASIYGPFVKDELNGARNNGFRPRRIGWYRKHLSIPRDLTGKRVYLHFEGIFTAGHIWVNGEKVGRHANGYLDSYWDVTDLVRTGDNLIAVRYDNRKPSTSRWYSGEGIYRNVWLTVMDDLHIEFWGGVNVTTPEITAERALVAVRTRVRNDTDAGQKVSITTEIQDAQGKAVNRAVSTVPVRAGDLYSFQQQIEVRNPALWSTEDPVLYTTVTTVGNAEGITDTVTTPFGIRTVEMTPDQGLLLNGKKVFAQGVCLHHDLGCLGSAAFDRAIERRLETLKEMGCNAVRLSHNPYSTAVLDFCDRMGILVFDELYDHWANQFHGDGIDFQKQWREDVRVFLERDWNHPSVFIWSVGNEPVSYQLKAENHYGVDQLRTMVDFVHQLEPTRKVTCALWPGRHDGIAYSAGDAYTNSEPHQMAFEMDVMSANYQSHFFAKDKAKYPQLITLLSEASTAGLGERWFDYDRSKTVGQFYWGGTDYIGESFSWPSKGWVNGFIDLCDWFKPISRYVQSFYSEQSMVFIAMYDEDEQTQILWNEVNLSFDPMASHWNWPEGQTLKVLTFSSGDQVELLLNGKSLGTQSMADYPRQKMAWEVPYEPGTLQAVALKDGRVVAEHTLRTAGKAERIVLAADRPAITADGLDLAYITAQVVDKNGVRVPHAENSIHFDIQGPGTNAGVCNSNLLSDELWQADHRSAYEGRCLLVVRAQRQPGRITIRATSPGLEAAVLSIQTVQWENRHGD